MFHVLHAPGRGLLSEKFDMCQTDFLLKLSLFTRRIFLLRPTQDIRDSRRRQTSTERHGILALIVYAFPQPSTLRQLKDCYKTERFFSSGRKIHGNIFLFFENPENRRMSRWTNTKNCSFFFFAFMCHFSYEKSLLKGGTLYDYRKLHVFYQSPTRLKL